MCPSGQNHSLQSKNKRKWVMVGHLEVLEITLRTKLPLQMKILRSDPEVFPQGSRALLCPFWWWTDLFPLPLLSSHLSLSWGASGLCQPPPLFFSWGSDPRTSAQWIPKGFLLILAMLTVKHETEQTEVVGTKNSKSCQFVVSVLQGMRTISTHTPPNTHTSIQTHRDSAEAEKKVSSQALSAGWEQPVFLLSSALLIYVLGGDFQQSVWGSQKSKHSVRCPSVLLSCRPSSCKHLLVYCSVDPAPADISWSTVTFSVMSLPVSPGLRSQPTQPACL